ncbi:MAG: methyltransferase domain-containing protein [Saprospiraceae bacterium]
MTTNVKTPQSIADIYDSKPVDAFLKHLYKTGGMHIGTYKKGKKNPADGANNTTLRLIRFLPNIKKKTRMLILGSDYGAAARYIVEKYNCKVDCLNISELQNKFNRKQAEADELDDYLTVNKGVFAKTPFERETYDIIWSQDALYYSKEKLKIFREVVRLLQPEGRFIFTDIMLNSEESIPELKKLLPAIHFKNMATEDQYKKLSSRVDLERAYLRTIPEQLVTHFENVLSKVESDQKELIEKSNKKTVETQTEELKGWLTAAESGYLSWGIMMFQKRNV